MMDEFVLWLFLTVEIGLEYTYYLCHSFCYDFISLFVRADDEPPCRADSASVYDSILNKTLFFFTPDVGLFGDDGEV
jgi:hypothetical protein